MQYPHFNLSDGGCFCGSSIPYENCHSIRRYNGLIDFYVDLGKVRSNTGFCLAESEGRQCGKRPIKSHSLQKSRSLKLIAKDGLVATFATGPHGKFKKGAAEPFVKTHINEASTFRGFCAACDSKIFEGIESDCLKVDFRSALLSCYRAHCHEIFMQQAHTFFVQWGNDDPNRIQFQSDLEEQVFAETLPMIENWRRHLKQKHDIKRLYQARLSGGRNVPFWYVGIELEGYLPFASTGAFVPQFDFAGRQTYDFFKDQVFDYVAFAIHPVSETRAVAFVGCTPSNQRSPLKRFLTSLKGLDQQEKLVACLLGLAARNENSYFDIDWLEMLDPHDRQKIVTRSEVPDDFLYATDEIMPIEGVVGGIRVVSLKGFTG